MDERERKECLFCEGERDEEAGIFVHQCQCKYDKETRDRLAVGICCALFVCGPAMILEEQESDERWLAELRAKN